MLLAEGLAARKDALTQIRTLQDRIATAAVHLEDEKPNEDARELQARLTQALDDFESLSVRINRTNNEAVVAFDGERLTLMQAVARREKLLMAHKARKSVADTIAPVSDRYGYHRKRTSKDDLRQVVTLDVKGERKAADDLAETVRRLDLAVQQVNWTTEMVEG